MLSLCTIRVFLLFVSYGGERYEKRDMQERVRERFMELYQLDMEAAQKQQQQQGDDEKRIDNNNNNNQDGNNMIVIPSWTFVDAAQSVEQVEHDVWKAVQETIHKVREQNKPVGKMFASGTLQLPTTSTTTVVNDDDDDENDDWELLLTANTGSDEENQEPPTTISSPPGETKVE